MDERMALISSWVSGDYSISELAAEFGISRKTTYKWIERYETGGVEALADQSRAPHHHPNAVAPEVERALLELKAQRPLWGAPKLLRKLELALGAEHCPAESTVSEILRRHGLSRIARRRRRATPSAQPFAACQEANAVWCADFKGWFRTGDGAKCTPLTISGRAQPVSAAVSGPGRINRVHHGAAAVHRHVPGVGNAGGHSHRQRGAVCQHGTGRVDRAVGVVGAARAGAGADRAGPAATKRAARTDAPHAQGRHGANRREPTCDANRKPSTRSAMSTTRSVRMRRSAKGHRRKFTGQQCAPIPSGCRDSAAIPTIGKSARCARVAKLNGRDVNCGSPTPSSARKWDSSRSATANGPSTTKGSNSATSTNALTASNPPHNSNAPLPPS